MFHLWLEMDWLINILILQWYHVAIILLHRPLIPRLRSGPGFLGNVHHTKATDAANQLVDLLAQYAAGQEIDKVCLWDRRGLQVDQHKSDPDFLSPVATERCIFNLHCCCHTLFQHWTRRRANARSCQNTFGAVFRMAEG